MGWTEGAPSPDPPVNVVDEGPNGAGDHALFAMSSGTQGPGGRSVIFNRTQWTGDFVAAGVTDVTAMVRASTASAPLNLRIGFEGGTGNSRFVSATPVAIPNDDQWYPVQFDLNDLVLVDGMEDAQTVLSDVLEMRLLSNVATSWFGEVGFTETYVDNITAVPEPATALWIFALGTAWAYQRRRTA